MSENVLRWVLDHRWAILPESLDVIIDLIARVDLTPDTIAKALHGSQWEKYMDENGHPITPSSLITQSYPILDNTLQVSLANGVAILPIVGPITPRSSMFSRMSGMTSVQSLANDFNVAVNSRDVNAIILDIDSPGGEVTGINEFAEMIFKAQAEKPILAYIYGLGASAGYWIASAASEIIMSPTAEAGSIGVVAAYTSYKDSDAKRGIKEIEIVSSQSPFKRPDIETTSGRAQIQKIVDDLANVFITSVAKHRGISNEDVLSSYGQGNLFVGEIAVKQGLADRVGNLETLISEYETKKSQFNFNFGGSMNLAELKASHPALYLEAINLGKAEAKAEMEKEAEAKIKGARDEGAEAENARIRAIEEVDALEEKEIIAANRFDRKQTKESISALILKSQAEKRKKMEEETKNAGHTLANNLAGVGADTPSQGDAERSGIAKVAAEAGNNTKSRQ